jgi:hypothetical protein
MEWNLIFMVLLGLVWLNVQWNRFDGIILFILGDLSFNVGMWLILVWNREIQPTSDLFACVQIIGINAQSDFCVYMV